MASLTKETPISRSWNCCLLLAVVMLAVSGQAEPQSKPKDKPGTTDPVFVGAGGIASCDDSANGIALLSGECRNTGGCDRISPQAKWLK